MKAIFEVEESDLVGGIENFPIEVVEKMIEEQVRQGNEPNVEVFQKFFAADVENGGFNWEDAEDGYRFWQQILEADNVDVFFKKYPKNLNLVYIVGDSEVGMGIIKTLEKYGGVNLHNYRGDSDGVLYFIEPNNNTIEMCCLDGKDKILYEVLLATYTAIEAEEDNILEVTMEEIAEKFGVDVENLRIKQ